MSSPDWIVIIWATAIVEGNTVIKLQDITKKPGTHMKLDDKTNTKLGKSRKAEETLFLSVEIERQNTWSSRPQLTPV